MARSNEFQREVGKFLEIYFPLSYRLDDSNTNRYGSFQVSQKGFDYFGMTNNNRFFVCEAKKTKLKALPNNNIKPHQREELIKVSEAGGESWLMINWRFDRKCGEACFIPSIVYFEIEKKVGGKSTNFIHIPKFYMLERKVGGWTMAMTHPLLGV